MSTNYIAPIWRMPENANNTPDDKLSNYSMDFQNGGSSGRHINCGTDLFTDSTIPSISISAWIKTSASGVIMSKDIATNLNRNFLFQIAGNQLYWQTSVDGTNFDNLIVSQSTFDVIDSQWHHIVVTYNAGTSSGDGEKKIYIDGSEIADSPLATYAEIYNTSSVPINIGRRGDNSRYFYDNMSQVCIFNYALSSSQVSYLYGLDNPMAITGGEPVAYWPLGDNSNPNSPGSFPNISVVADSVFDFNASGYIDIPDSDTLSFGDGVNDSPFTMSAWIKTTSSAGRGIISKWGNTGTSGYEWIFWTVGSPALVRLNLNDNTNLVYQFRQGSTQVDTGEWFHVVATYDGRGGNGTLANTANQGIKIYINGIEESSYSDGNNPTGSGYVAMHNTPRQVQIGAYNSVGQFNGEISNAEIWDVVLQPSEILELYNNGQPLMTGTQPQEANLKAWYKLNQSANWEADTLVEWQIPDAVSSYPQSFDFVKADGDRVLVAPVDAGTGPINSINGAMTVAIWVKTTQGTVYEYAINRDYGGNPNRDWSLLKDNFYGGGGRMIWSLFNTVGTNLAVRLTGSTDPQGDPLITMNDGKWHHIVGVYNGTDTAELYTDGVLQGSTTLSGFGNLKTNARTVIGGFNNSGNPLIGTGSWNGNLSNAQIWNTNLNATQVETLYNNGVPLTTAIATDNLKGWWKLDNTEVWSADNTYYTIDRWDIDNNKYPSYFKTALEFNANEYVSLDLDGTGGSSSVIGSGSDLDLTFSYWVNPNYQNSRGSFKWGTGPGNTSNWFINITHGRFPNRWNLNVYNDATIRIQYDVPTTDIWYHLIVTRTASDNTWRMYVNDALVGSYSDGGTVTAQNYATKLFLGNGRNNSLEGFISNAYIWNSSLSATDRTLLYNNGRPLSDLSSLSAQPFSWWKLDNKTTGVQDSIGVNNATITGGRVANTLVSTQAAYSSGMTEQNLVNNNVSALNGESSGMNTTNLVQSNLTRKVPFSNYSIYFDGTDYFGNNVTTLDSIAGAMSISCWVNFSSGSATSLTVTNKGASPYSTSTRDFELYLNYVSTTTRQIRFSGDSTSSSTYVNSVSNINADEWTHIAITTVGDNTASNTKIYINGQLDNTDDFINISNTSSPFYVGIRSDASGRPYVGNISNMAFWDNVLTEDDVLNIYNNGITQDLNNFRIKPACWFPIDENASFWEAVSGDWETRDLSNNELLLGNNTGAIDEMQGNAPGSEANGSGSNFVIGYLEGNMYNSDKNAYSINMADYADGVTNPANSGRSTDTP